MPNHIPVYRVSSADLHTQYYRVWTKADAMRAYKTDYNTAPAYCERVNQGSLV